MALLFLFIGIHEYFAFGQAKEMKREREKEKN
jgi:hypothetical protein